MYMIIYMKDSTGNGHLKFEKNKDDKLRKKDKSKERFKKDKIKKKVVILIHK